MFVVVISGCRQAEPTPVALQAAATSVPPTAVSTETATTPPTDTPSPTDTPAPTFTFTPSATPLPLLVVVVMDEADEALLPGSAVLLDDAGLTFHAEQTVNADGRATFADLVVGEMYTVTVKADGYLAAILPVDFAVGVNELEVTLAAGQFVTVTAEDASLRSGPGAVYGRIADIEPDTVLQVIGRDERGDWLLVLTDEDEKAWLAVAQVDVGEMEVAAVTAVSAPATPTPAPTTAAAVPVSQPPAAAPPLGQNLLVNPGFENGAIGWDIRAETYQFDIFPNMVRSGQGALRLQGRRYQLITGLTVGTTYRFGVWARIWSGNGEERGVSDAPGNAIVRICLNTIGDIHPDLPTTVCSNWASPIDTWQYFTIDAEATTDRMVAMMFFAYSRENAPNHNESAWDDAHFGVAPVAATPTPTPVPVGPLVRPAPVPFDAVALRDNMSQVEQVLNHMGGLLDRLVRGSWETCQEYEGYYSQLVTSATYHSLPDEWLGVYNEYIFAVDNAVGFNNGIYSVCQDGSGSVTQQAYGEARSSIADSLNRLIPAVQQANALLGG